MANELTIFTEPLTQLGILGVIFLYVIYSDWNARKERTKIEAARVKRDNDREEACTKRIRELEERQLRYMQTVSLRTNAVLEDLTNELRRHGFNMKTPLPELPDITEDETRIIHRNIKGH
jgi:hypothetical protein